MAVDKDKLIELLIVAAVVSVIIGAVVIGRIGKQGTSAVQGIVKLTDGVNVDYSLHYQGADYDPSDSSSSSGSSSDTRYIYFDEIRTRPNVEFDSTYFGKVLSRERSGPDIEKIILHHTAGSSVAGAVKTWQTLNGMASAHYIIDKDGIIFYILDESRRANHAGCHESKSSCTSGERCAICTQAPVPATNTNSIGIEIINEGRGNDPYTDAQYESIKKLIRDIALRYGININTKNSQGQHINVLGHCQVTADKPDPSSNFEWEKIGLAEHVKCKPFPAGGPEEKFVS